MIRIRDLIDFQGSFFSSRFFLRVLYKVIWVIKN